MRAEDYLKNRNVINIILSNYDAGIPDISLSQLLEEYHEEFNISAKDIPITYAPNQLLNKRILAVVSEQDQTAPKEYKVIEFSPKGDFLKLLPTAEKAPAFWMLTFVIKINAVLNDESDSVKDVTRTYCNTEGCCNIAMSYNRANGLCMECQQEHNSAQSSETGCHYDDSKKRGQ